MTYLLQRLEIYIECTLVFCFGIVGSEYDLYEINMPVLCLVFEQQQKISQVNDLPVGIVNIKNVYKVTN